MLKTIYLAGGINKNVSPFLFQDGEMEDVQNFTTPKIGVLKKTGDYSLTNARITASQDMLGGVDFKRADGTHEHYVAIDGSANAGIYKDSGSAWVTQSQSLTKANKVRFAYSSTLDSLFASNYVDATRSYNGTSWSTSTFVTDAPKSKYIVDFAQRIYLLNCTVGSDSFFNRAYRSSIITNDTATWDTTLDWIAFGDAVTGVGKNGENMFVGCKNSIWVFTPTDASYRVSEKGCVSHDGIADYNTWTFYPSFDGMYVFDGSSITKISSAVQEFWTAIANANLSKIKAKVRGDHLYVSIGDVTVDSRALTNVVLDYDILQNMWTRMTLAENVEDMHLYTESTGIELFIGNDDGEVFQMFDGEDQYSSPISSFIETPWYYGSGPTEIDDFSKLWVHGKQCSGLKVKYRIDSGGWTPVGEVTGFADFVKLNVSGKRIKFLLEETSKDNMYEVHSLDIEFTPKFSERNEN